MSTFYTMMEESLELRIDVSLDQNKDSYVDVVNLESDCPIVSSSSSSDGGNISGPEHVELVSPTTPPKVVQICQQEVLQFVIC